jgi:hypothetical protein
VSLAAVRAALLSRRAWCRLRTSKPVESLACSPVRQSQVLKSAAGTLLALTITGLISPAGTVKGVVAGVGDVVLPGPSAAERSVDSLYGEVESSPFWTSRPTMSSGSKQVLVDDWETFRTDKPHRFSARGARKVALDELFEDRSLDGRRVIVQGYVAQLFPVDPVEGRDDLVKASFRIGIAQTAEVAWCGRGTFHRDRVPQEDQLVDVLGVPLARGPANVASGGFTIGTYLVCSGVRPLVDAEAAKEVAALFRDEEESRMWLTRPSVSYRARRFLMRAWDRLTPYRAHPYPSHRVMPIGIDRVYEDTRFDGRLLGIAGYVTQRVLQPGGDGMTREQVRIQGDGQGNAVWCRTTVQNRRVFGVGEWVEAVGVPYARGPAKLEGGGFDNSTYFVCPAMRRF